MMNEKKNEREKKKRKWRRIVIRTSAILMYINILTLIMYCLDLSGM